MKAEEIQKICVIGAGQMGRQVALNTAKYGYKVFVWDNSTNALTDAADWVKEYLRGRIEKGKMTADEALGTSERFHIAGSLKEAATDADLLIEAIVEDRKAKEDLFRLVDSLVSWNCLITTNSSFMVSSSFATCVSNPARLANLHYFNPALIMELVEVVKGDHTSRETVDTLLEFCRRTGKKPVLLAKEIDGFIANRLLLAINDVALGLYEGGYATPADIDTAAVKGLGHPMGPFALMDLVGNDVSYLVKKRKFEEDGMKPIGFEALKAKFEAGEFGVKSGKGWYTYQKSPRGLNE